MPNYDSIKISSISDFEELDDLSELFDEDTISDIDLEEEFISRIDSNSENDNDDGRLTEEEKEMYVIENSALVHYVAKKFQNTRISHDELVDIANLGLVKALNGYKKNKGVKFSTYAHSCMNNEILFFLRKEKKHRENTVSFNNPISTDKDGHIFEEESRISNETNGNRSLEENAEIEEAVRCLCEIINDLNDTERLIIVSRYGLMGSKVKTQKEIADEVNMSQANISKLEKNVLTKISKLMTAKYGFDYINI